MKNAIFSFILLLGCTTTITSISAQKKSRIVTDYLERWEQIITENLPELINEEHFSADVKMIGGSESVSGLANYRAHYEDFLNTFSEARFTVLDHLTDGKKVMWRWRFQGAKDKSPANGAAAGRILDYEGMTITTFKNGKVTEEIDFLDHYEILQQLGQASEPANMLVVQGIYDAFATGDMASFFGALDEKVVWNEAEGNPLADRNPYVGHDAVLEGVFVRLMADHEYFKVKDISLHEMANNRVLVTGRYDAKVKGSGTLVDCQMAHLWTLEDGKVVAFQQYADTRQLAEAANKPGGNLSVPTGTEAAQITETVRDYLEGLDTNAPDRLAKALHPDLAKRVVEKNEEGKEFPSNMTAASLIGYTKDFDFSLFYKADSDAKAPLKVDVSIYDVTGEIATVKAVTNKFEFVDYIQLGKIDGEWKIINILWAWTGSTNKWMNR